MRLGSLDGEELRLGYSFAQVFLGVPELRLGSRVGYRVWRDVAERAGRLRELQGVFRGPDPEGPEFIGFKIFGGLND